MNNKPDLLTRLRGKNPLQRLLRPVKQQLMGTVTHVDTTARVAAISFDDGPHDDHTPKILEILKKHDVHATFFMVGQAASQHPELVRQVYQAGHAIGNHTYHHVALPSLKIWEQIKEIGMGQRAILPYGSYLLRPPWGKQTNGSRWIASLLGYKVVAWNLSVEDWRDHRAESMADRLAEGLRPGSIVLLHDRIFSSALQKPQYDRSAAFEAVDLFLNRVSDTFRFVTIPQLFTYGKPHYVMWQRPV